MRNRVKVTSGGRITIPSAARKKLGLKAGDQLIAELTEEGIMYTPISTRDLVRHRLGKRHTRRNEE